MTQKLQAVRGMHDILPDKIAYWQYLEAKLTQLACRYGYQEIRTPIVEKTELFARSIGAVTDIVEKEMYTFIDRNQDSLTLRPEGTACTIRAGIEHGLFYNQTQRLWYLGPLFRHERPQRGRCRQFHQFGLEAFGFAGPDIDAELILFGSRLWRELGISVNIELQLNSLGSPQTRAEYRDVLRNYFKQHRDSLDADSQRRLDTNPLRILDSKNPKLQDLISNAPQLTDYLDPESQAHFAGLLAILDAAQVKYRLNPRLVRGLDYYTGTVFEWITTELGAQGTVCAGGRYDLLVEQLGGQATTGVGFAMGCERIIEILAAKLALSATQQPLQAYLITVGVSASQQGLLLAEALRDKLPTLRLFNHCGGGSFKNQFKRADKSGAEIALILGEDELMQQTIGIKFLREQKEQQTLPQAELVDYLERLFMLK